MLLAVMVCYEIQIWFGGLAFKDVAGADSRRGVTLSYAYHLKVKKALVFLGFVSRVFTIQIRSYYN